jgi:monooxygenase
MAGARMPVADDEGGLVFVNHFTVRAEPEHFERVFAETSEHFARQPGFVGHTLVRRLDRPDEYVNIARWTDQAAFQNALAHPGFAPHARSLRAISTGDSHLYEVRRQRSRDTR